MGLKTLKTLNNRKTAQHPFHVLTNSKLPIMIASVVGILAFTFVAKLHGVAYLTAFDNYSKLISQVLFPHFIIEETQLSYLNINSVMLCLSALLFILIGSWGLRLIKESTLQGHHSLKVQLALKYGFLLFLLSEAMLFFPFFWAFFHGALSPAVAIGGVWPPTGIKGAEVLDPFMLPMVNTIVLLCSGVAVVAAHRAILSGYKDIVLNMLYLAISFGIFFS